MLVAAERKQEPRQTVTIYTGSIIQVICEYQMVGNTWNVLVIVMHRYLLRKLQRNHMLRQPTTVIKLAQGLNLNNIFADMQQLFTICGGFSTKGLSLATRVYHWLHRHTRQQAHHWVIAQVMPCNEHLPDPQSSSACGHRQQRGRSAAVGAAATAASQSETSS